MMPITEERTWIGRFLDYLGGGALGAGVIFLYFILSAGFVLLLLYLIQLLYQVIIGV